MGNNENINNQVNESNNTQEKKQNSSKTIGIVLLIIGLLLLGVGGSKLFVEKGDPDKPKNDNNHDNGNNNVISEQIYKTSDGKYTFKLLENGKAFIDEKEIVIDSKEENNRYIEIRGDFNPSPNYIEGLGFVLDKDTKLIVESPYYDETYNSGDCGFDSYGEYARFCTRCYGFNVLIINNWYFFEKWNETVTSEIYTTNWKKLGYADIDNIKYDEKGIYVCDDYYEFGTTCKSGEFQYDVSGNAIDN